MDFANYLNDIPAVIMTAFAALGGTATALGTLFAWLAKVVKNLKAGKNDYEEKATIYEEKAQRFEERSEKLSATGAILEQFGAVLSAYGEDFSRLTEQNKEMSTKYDVLAKVLMIMVNNTPLMVQNGTANEVQQLLYPGQTDNQIEEIGEVICNEIDS